MKLYGYWRSSASWRVRIALAYKGVAYESMPVHLVRDGGEHRTEAYRELNPMAQVPTLEIDEGGRTHRLTQSLAILEFLEERFPEPALLPKDRWLRASARRLAEIINSGIQPLQNLSITQYVKAIPADEQAWARHFITNGLTALDASATETSGTYLVGDAVTFADVCLVPQLYQARRFGVDLGPLPRLTRIEAQCLALPPFQSAHADAQPDAVV